LRGLAGTGLEERGRVLERGVRIYSSDELARVSLERDLLTQWLDWKPAADALHAERLRAIAEKGL